MVASRSGEKGESGFMFEEGSDGVKRESEAEFSFLYAADGAIMRGS
jgi:hypothetical protein